MSIKHALVVDDSKLAQVALKRQLEEHELVVELADSGEEALELLERHTVDVIFMDHTMPGMDGLQALAAIKRNPRTAMIPVMMYTTKEGEVYVGQARALGGIGVLPKNVQPHVLFDMLVNLGLVKDKRAATAPDADAPRRRTTDVREDGEPPRDEQRFEQPAGLALAALMNRIIEDQAALRAEFRIEHARLAREVAVEVVEVVEAHQTVRAAPDEIPDPPPSPRPSKVPMGLAALFASTTLIFAVLAWNAVHSGASATPSSDDHGKQLAQLGELKSALRSAQTRARARYLAGIDALQWSVNQHAGFAFDELPFDDTRADELRDLLERLVALQFRGRVRIESHLGEFCFVNDEAGSYRLAPPDLPIEACTFVGHPEDNSAFVADRQSVGFADFFTNSPLVNESGIVLELVAHDRSRSSRRAPFAPDVGLAGDWNRTAERNNRLEFSLIPTSG